MATILIVDDELAIAESLAVILEEEGYTAICAANGRQGLEKAAAFKPALIILDFVMPLMGGAEMGAALRAHPSLKTVKILLNSSLPEAAVNAEFADYDAFVRKPYTIYILLEVIRRLLSGS